MFCGGAVGSGSVIDHLRDFDSYNSVPRMRHSERWTRNGKMNPSEQSSSWADFGTGNRSEMESTLVLVFGDDVIERIREVIRDQGKIKTSREQAAAQ